MLNQASQLQDRRPFVSIYLYISIDQHSVYLIHVLKNERGREMRWRGREGENTYPPILIKKIFRRIFYLVFLNSTIKLQIRKGLCVDVITSYSYDFILFPITQVINTIYKLNYTIHLCHIHFSNLILNCKI